jgi:hypothetical protein
MLLQAAAFAARAGGLAASAIAASAPAMKTRRTVMA